MSESLIDVLEHIFKFGDKIYFKSLATIIDRFIEIFAVEVGPGDKHPRTLRFRHFFPIFAIFAVLCAQIYPYKCKDINPKQHIKACADYKSYKFSFLWCFSCQKIRNMLTGSFYVTESEATEEF